MFVFIVIGLIVAAFVSASLAPFFNPHALGITIVRLFKEIGRKIQDSLEKKDERR